MTPLVYDIALAVGLLSVGAGAFLSWGAAVALLVTGALVIGLTLFGAIFGPRR